jgi:ATP synthase protein I
MADNPRDSDESEQPTPGSAQSAEEAALSARLRGLGDQLGQHRPREPSDSHQSDSHQGPSATGAGYALGFRLSSELVAGVLVGAGLGWAIDKVLGISPWGLIVFLLLGFVAGVVNVVRTAGAGSGNDPGRPPGS